MKRLLAELLCLFVPMLAFAATGGNTDANSYKVMYDGGSVQNIKSGNSAQLVIEPTQIRLIGDKQELVVIPASAVTEISYGQDVHRRIGAAMAWR